MQSVVATGLVKRPTQAVILAGGRGTRLRPITDTRPKAMVEIQGKPFLEYLIEQLRDQGFERVLVLLGYLPGVVQQYFGDGSRWGIKIEYSVTAVGNETGRRVKLVEHHLAPCFLLLYCDNYWPMQIDRMWKRFADSDAEAMITVYSNKDGYTTNSVQVGSDGYVTIYDKSCTGSNLQGVEISYAFIKKSVVAALPEDNVLFEVAAYLPLAQKRRLLGYVTDHRYYSIGSHRRLPLTRAFFTRQPTVILDRDGVLNKKPPKAEYVRTWEEFEWLPQAKEALMVLNQNGYRVIIVSNQAGIARGAMTESHLEEIHANMRKEVAQAGGQIHAIYHCPHDWDEGCECRKPKPGMLFQAQRDHSLDLTRTLLIGDDERDKQAAEAAGCPSVLVSEREGLWQVTRRLLAGQLQVTR